MKQHNVRINHKYDKVSLMSKPKMININLIALYDIVINFVLQKIRKGIEGYNNKKNNIAINIL